MDCSRCIAKCSNREHMDDCGHCDECTYASDYTDGIMKAFEAYKSVVEYPMRNQSQGLNSALVILERNFKAELEKLNRSIEELCC